MAGTRATCQDIVQQRARKIVCAAAAGWPYRDGNQNSQLALADKAADPPGHMFEDSHGQVLWRRPRATR